MTASDESSGDSGDERSGDSDGERSELTCIYSFTKYLIYQRKRDIKIESRKLITNM